MHLLTSKSLPEMWLSIDQNDKINKYDDEI